MAHARRKFIEALKYDKERATYVLGRMQVLYALEERMPDRQVPEAGRQHPRLYRIGLDDQRLAPLGTVMGTVEAPGAPAKIPAGGRDATEGVGQGP
jgi:hypothetical protein